MFTNDAAGAALRTRANNLAPLENLGEAVHKTKCMIKAVYDFAVQGGATGALALVDDAGNPAILPKGAIVTRCFAKVLTSVTSGGSATVGLTLLTASDLVVATAKASLTAGTLVEGVCDGTAAAMVGPVTVATGTVLSAQVAVAALTAGKIQFFVDYVIQ